MTVEVFYVYPPMRKNNRLLLGCFDGTIGKVPLNFEELTYSREGNFANFTLSSKGCFTVTKEGDLVDSNNNILYSDLKYSNYSFTEYLEDEKIIFLGNTNGNVIRFSMETLLFTEISQLVIWKFFGRFGYSLTKNVLVDILNPHKSICISFKCTITSLVVVNSEFVLCGTREGKLILLDFNNLLVVKVIQCSSITISSLCYHLEMLYCGSKDGKIYKF